MLRILRYLGHGRDEEIRNLCGLRCQSLFLEVDPAIP